MLGYWPAVSSRVSFAMINDYYDACVVCFRLNTSRSPVGTRCCIASMRRCPQGVAVVGSAHRRRGRMAGVHDEVESAATFDVPHHRQQEVSMASR